MTQDERHTSGYKVGGYRRGYGAGHKNCYGHQPTTNKQTPPYQAATRLQSESVPNVAKATTIDLHDRPDNIQVDPNVIIIIIMYTLI